MNGVISNFDSYWFHVLNGWVLHPALAEWLFAIALYGIALYLLLFIWLWYRRSTTGHYHQKTVVLAVLAVFVTMIVAQVSDLIINRPRPAIFYHDVMAFNVLVDQASFPSLHTAVAFSITAVLWLMDYRKLASASLVLAVAIGMSRIAMGVHYPTDIIGGAMVGFLVGWIVWREASWLRDYLPSKREHRL